MWSLVLEAANLEFSTAVSSDVATRSTLKLDITLEWQLSFLEQLGLSLNEILAVVDLTGDNVSTAISALLGDVLPADGFVEIGIGLERTVVIDPPAGTPAFEGTSCYVLGTTGLKLALSGGTDGTALAFNGMLGPFSRNFGIDLNFLDELSLNVSLDPSISYYINSSLPASLLPSSFEVVSDVPGLIGKLGGFWNGGIQSTLTAAIPAIDVDLDLDLSFPAMQELFATPMAKIAIFDILSSSTKFGNFE
jgi:hypothetical protein